VFGFCLLFLFVQSQSVIHSFIHSFGIQSVIVVVVDHHPPPHLLHGRHMASAIAIAVTTAPPPPMAVLPPPDTFSFGAVAVPWHATVDDVVQAGRV
jgi:hypothetical protein